MIATPRNACAVNLRISDFYIKAELFIPLFFSNREFAVIRDGVMYRHLSFTSIESLRCFLVEKSPDHVYYSVAKYTYPNINDMGIKKSYWEGSDLPFDIDYDHLKMKTLKEAKKQSIKLISILKEDFGLSHLTYAFSGRRGYHVVCHDACIQKLENAERREIADYFQEFLPGRKNRKGEPVPNRKYVQIDAPVTCDFTRLIRLPGTIHGMSGHVCELLPLPKSMSSD